MLLQEKAMFCIPLDNNADYFNIILCGTITPYGGLKSGDLSRILLGLDQQYEYLDSNAPATPAVWLIQLWTAVTLRTTYRFNVRAPLT
jgi:hypothetical protein